MPLSDFGSAGGGRLELVPEPERKQSVSARPGWRARDL